MKLHKALFTSALALMALSVTSCHDDDDSTPAGPVTLKQLAVNDINNRTTDTVLPVEINDLVIDDANEDPAQYDELLQSI